MELHQPRTARAEAPTRRVHGEERRREKERRSSWVHTYTAEPAPASGQRVLNCRARAKAEEINPRSSATAVIAGSAIDRDHAPSTREASRRERDNDVPIMRDDPRLERLAHAGPWRNYPAEIRAPHE